MTNPDNAVVVTGIGLVTALGVGSDVHRAALTSGSVSPRDISDSENFAPYTVFPLPEIDWSQQIPRRGDQRQMENWQRLGVFAAGMALDDAGFKDDLEACATMDMIVAAGGGERDIAVDTLIVEESRKRNDRDVLLNEKLTTELRPTLFLAQLSNLLAGNISIVHKVTGSSRTLMGEEGAGISAIETAHARITAGQSTHCLVGGAFVAERYDMILLLEAIQGLAKGGLEPFWDQNGDAAGMNLGTAGAFLVLESRAHAEARGAHIYASLDGALGDRGSRDEGKLEQRLSRLCDETGAAAGSPETLVFCGASGFPGLSGRERAFLQTRYPDAPLRSYGALFGHSLEAQFITGLALASLALDESSPIKPMAPGVDAEMPEAAKSAIVTTIGHARGEGVARLSKLS
ncbi:3-oxoacyl-(acyl-carrier-protein) synthase [Hoeflea phototrophica DFL-43]|uniref:3-oxoacyl-(Acyl-carrier-protein) synthase n=1 Tax=Hoeflea phototrophica (strain DSM 17068 / NCIMB 14078 / DFL-43) TaxID=411684 RepID=A9DHM7_HOEPD|nr:beta-ketoacyl-ACP synthase [Hoeflea phototrophica]EDQ31459.1 3-oxoacyl-(acyl-carrier-protein) synthase [Hoeflea phototrophica DFL-43]